MQGQFRWQHFSVHPTAQLVVELGGRFPFDSLALAEGFDPALQLGQSFGRLLQPFNRRLQFGQLFLDQCLDQRTFVSALVLERDFVAFTIRFSGSVHRSLSSFRQAVCHRLLFAIAPGNLPEPA
jgi:hypothetical protein